MEALVQLVGVGVLVKAINKINVQNYINYISHKSQCYVTAIFHYIQLSIYFDKLIVTD